MASCFGEGEECFFAVEEADKIGIFFFRGFVEFLQMIGEELGFLQCCFVVKFQRDTLIAVFRDVVMQ